MLIKIYQYGEVVQVSQMLCFQFKYLPRLVVIHYLQDGIFTYRKTHDKYKITMFQRWMVFYTSLAEKKDWIGNSYASNLYPTHQ